MEFNKSNRFNDNNENQAKQTLIHYKGEIGEFDYDPNIWQIIDNHLSFKIQAVVSLPENLELPKGCTDMSFMFYYCKNLKDITPLQNWNTSKVENMQDMFYNCKNLTDITPLQNWDTSKVENMSYMFYNCRNLIDITQLQKWNTSKVRDMPFMFSNCHNLTDISSLENWDTSNVEDMLGMFHKS